MYVVLWDNEHKTWDSEEYVAQEFCAVNSAYGSCQEDAYRFVTEDVEEALEARLTLKEIYPEYDYKVFELIEISG